MRRPLVGLVLLVLLACACTPGGTPTATTPRSPVGAGETMAPEPTSGTASPVPGGVDPLCREDVTSPGGDAGEGPGREEPPPPYLRELVRQVEELRGLRFLKPVHPQGLRRPALNDVILEAIDAALPRALARRRGRAWGTIGVLPKGTDLRAAIQDLGTSQYFGLYLPEQDRLVYLGSVRRPSPLARLLLVHELVHALEDQVFDLDRLDATSTPCDDDAPTAFLSVLEGSAQVVSLRWAASHLTVEERIELQGEIADIEPPPPSTPPFLRHQLEFPYLAGQAFVEDLLERGGTEALDDAVRTPPTSTEQVLHPDAYPADEPQDVRVHDVADLLGPGWSSLDLMDVGEGWLRGMLELRLEDGQASRAAEGWDGGEYRAFAEGDATAILMETVWDSRRDAAEFVDAMEAWLGGQPGEVVADGTSVRVFFGSDRASVEALVAAAP